LATSQQPVHYFFALNLRNCLPLLPQLLGSILEAIRFLGPTSCALSIVEGNSPDGTAEVLAALEPELTKLGIRTYFTLNHALDPLGEGNNRFKSLASLRSMALDPLVATNPTLHTADDATVVFLNDVALCPDDILELAHQRRHQAADMACAMDWSGADPPLFYDVYVSRAINGDLFFDIPLPEGSWAHAADLFWNEPIARERLEKVEPFQVFSCWNGAVAFTAQPVVEGKVAFRSSRGDRGECHHGEPQVFCKDMWFAGYGKIMVVPSVNLEYAIDKGRVIKEVKGFTSSWVAREGSGMEAKIEWLPPPDQVKCMPTFQDQSWRPWNETLV
jgi:alpha-1,3-mannosyltransferase